MHQLIRLLFIGLITFCSSFQAQSQNIVFINQGENAVINDTSIVRYNSKINQVVFKPIRRNPSNTQFFRHPIEFYSVNIDSCLLDWVYFQHLIISDATFQQKLYLSQAHSDTLFLDNSNLRYGLAIVEGEFQHFFFRNNRSALSEFSHIKLNDGNFSYTRFEQAWFNHCSFNNTSFDHVAFLNQSSFNSCTFNNVTFRNVQFKNIDLSNSSFSETIVFDSCRFSETLKLSVLPDQKTLFSFDKARLPDTLDLSSNTTIQTPIDLTNADFKDNNRKCLIFLYNTDVDKINIDYIHFKLLLTNPQTGEKLSSDQAKRIYEKLLKSFKDKGQDENYDLLNQEYESYKVSLLPFLDRMWFYYAGKPTFVILWMLIWLLTFSIINIWVYRKLNDEVYTLSHFSEDSRRFNNTTSKKILNSIFYSFIYTGIVFFAFNINKEKVRYRKRLLLLWFFFIYAAGIVSIFLVAQLAFR